jgi:nucleoside-diphosphate-sugar epimerase
MAPPEAQLRKAAIVGATGPTGIHLGAALAKENIAVRAVSRSEANLATAFPGGDVEKVAADATDEAAVARAVEGCDVVFDCIGLPPDAMQLHEVTARNIAGAASKAGARCVQVSSYWAYMPLTRELIDESHPRVGGPPFARARRAAEDAMLEGRAAVLNLPDFYGPHVRIGTLIEALKAAAAGKAMPWIGSGDVARDAIYVPDAMAAAVKVARQPGAYGHRWIVPGGGPISGREMAAIAGRHLGRKVRLFAAPPFMLRLVSLFNAELRGFMPLVPEYVKPLRFDGTRLHKLIGELKVTPHETAIAATLDWLKGA